MMAPKRMVTAPAARRTANGFMGRIPIAKKLAGPPACCVVIKFSRLRGRPETVSQYFFATSERSHCQSRSLNVLFPAVALFGALEIELC